MCVLTVLFRIPNDIPGDVVLSLWYLPQRPRCGEPATLASGSRRRQMFSGTFARPLTSQSICMCVKDNVHPCIEAPCKTIGESCYSPYVGILLYWQLSLPSPPSSKEACQSLRHLSATGTIPPFPDTGRETGRRTCLDQRLP